MKGKKNQAHTKKGKRCSLRAIFDCYRKINCSKFLIKTWNETKGWKKEKKSKKRYKKIETKDVGKRIKHFLRCFMSSKA
jgi:uncharacterized protein YjcR